MKAKKGISLFVLVITIIVIIILAGAVILSINKNNPVNAANQATFLNDRSELTSAMSLQIANDYSKTNGQLPAGYNPLYGLNGNVAATTLNDVGDQVLKFAKKFKVNIDKASTENGGLNVVATSSSSAWLANLAATNDYTWLNAGSNGVFGDNNAIN